MSAAAGWKAGSMAGAGIKNVLPRSLRVDMEAELLKYGWRHAGVAAGEWRIRTRNRCLLDASMAFPALFDSASLTTGSSVGAARSFSNSITFHSHCAVPVTRRRTRQHHDVAARARMGSLKLCAPSADYAVRISPICWNLSKGSHLSRE